MNYWGLSDQGKIRSTNQDSFIVVKNPAENILAVVCDGIGGARNGDWASNIVVEKLGDEFQETSAFTNIQNCKKWFKAQLKEINNVIYEKSLLSADCKGMGTTVVGLITFKGGIMVANCGDSRCYSYYDDKLTQITVDHTLVSTMVAKGQLSKKDAIKHPKRHVLSRAVGVEKNVKFDFFELEEKKDVLLLCSDGLFGMVNEQEIKKVLKKRFSPEKKAKELLEIANNNGGYDNITVILLER